MLFIKNLTNLKGSQIKLNLHQGGEESYISISVDNSPELALLRTGLKGIAQSFKKSIERIGGIVNELITNDNVISTCILDNKPTEVNYGLKGTITVLKSTTEFPANIDTVEADETTKVHFPKDMIIFIVPKTVEGVDKTYRLVVDKRNLSSPIMTEEIGDYRIIAMSIKWAVWMKLKYPAYAYVKDNDDNVIYSIKLGYKVENKLTKNQLVEVDNKEAVDYLTETFRLLAERNEKKNDNHNKSFNKKPNNNNRKFDGQNNRRPYNSDRKNNDSRKSLQPRYNKNR